MRRDGAAGHLDPSVQPPKHSIWVVVPHWLGHGSAAGSMAGKCCRSIVGRFSGTFDNLSPELYSSQHPFVVAITLVGSWLRNIFRKDCSSLCAVDRGWQQPVLHAKPGSPPQRGFIVGRGNRRHRCFRDSRALDFRDRLVQCPAIVEQPGLGGLLVTDQSAPVDRVSLPLLHGTHMALVHGFGIWNALSQQAAGALDGDQLDQKRKHHSHLHFGFSSRFDAD